MLDMTRDEIAQLLHDARIGRLCMAAPDGKPYSLPFPFLWAEGTLYLRVALAGRKGQILEHNNQVCFEVDTFTDNLDDYASVLVEGRLVPVDDPEERTRVKQLNDAKYSRLRGGHRPGHGRSTPLAQLPLRKILVERLTGRRKQPHPAPADARFAITVSA